MNRSPAWSRKRRHPGAWWLGPEPVTRDVLSLLRLRAHVSVLRAQELMNQTQELVKRNQKTLARSRRLVRFSRWLLDSGRPLPRVVNGRRRSVNTVWFPTRNARERGVSDVRR